MLEKCFAKKYAILLTDENLIDSKKNKYIIVELEQDSSGEFKKICRPNLSSDSDISNAYSDIKHDGVNRWFYDNGLFLYNNKGQISWKFIKS